ncbi:subtilisin-like protein [Byssothecium circinans]|uniref:Subtilisin-like protein n=1 Tax=Byssothecium circinans TaxID=147558 RepID=A0A6A5URU9_9PLEO|nr:subtilisin-like protein [Byssothecium circinans]
MSPTQPQSASDSVSLSNSATQRPSTTTLPGEPQDTSSDRHPSSQMSPGPSKSDVPSSNIPTEPTESSQASPSTFGPPGISSSNPSDTNTAPTSLPKPHIVDALIDGQSYHLPSPEEPEISILLLDGSSARLFSNKVIMHGQTLNIPSGLSSSQEITSGGQTIKAQPGEAKQPDSNDHNGGGGIGSLFKGLTGAAGKITGSLANAGKGALDFASGASATTANTLASTFSATAGDMNKLVSSLNGIQQAFPAEQLTKAGLGTALGALNLGRGSLNFLTSMGAMLKGFDKLTPEVQEQTRKSLQDYAKPGGPLQQAEKAMKDFADFPWEEMESSSTATKTTQSSQGLSATSMDATGTQTPSRTSASTSTPTSAPIEALTQYWIRTKEGTSNEAFTNFIKELDGGVGQVGDTSEYDASVATFQTYMTDLRPSHAQDLKAKYNFLAVVHAFVFDPKELDTQEEFHAIPTSRGTTLMATNTSRDSLAAYSHKLKPRAKLPPDNDAPDWKKMISSPPRDDFRPPSQDPPYLADDSGGKGTTIYVLDDGFDIHFPELAATGRTVGTFVIPNQLTVPRNYIDNIRKVHKAAIVRDEDITLGFHGTKMATIAAGKQLGVAPNADLFLIKSKGSWAKSATATESINIGYQAPGMSRVLLHVRSLIQSRLNADASAKSVINMSWGIMNSQKARDMEADFEAFFEWCQRNKIPVVMGAGNAPEENLDEKVPHKFGTPTNTIITVGGVNKDGTLHESTSPARRGRAGSMTVFAPAIDIIVPGGPAGPHSGTSQAAAIVSGLVAYFYSHPGLGLLQNPNIPLPADDMKQFIVAHAWTRVPLPLGENVPYDNLNVIYNLARGDFGHPPPPCIVDFGKRATESVSACSSPLPSSTSSFTSTSTPSSTPILSATPSGMTTVTTTTTAAPSTSSTPTSSPQSPPTPTPAAEKCRITVAEFDNPDPNLHGPENWSIAIFPMASNALTNNTMLCFHGTTADEQTGVNVACPPLGDDDMGTVNVRREANDRLRFIWGVKTWTAEDKGSGCRSEGWKDEDRGHEKRRVRDTECVFECKVDWSRPPAMVLD